ncbi:hypothetical protein ACF08M_05870 [Streptomyces sp. NPDC015032]|uniref:hypothetical protein n=1 Tax=Streptomyces sp. NPDC015032 TaxID=3364937 RepID=UPI00370347D8
MSSTRDELRHVMLGSLFTPEVPLGSTRDILITCHVSATDRGKLHGSPECRTLRSAASVNQIDVPFGEAVARICPSCRWPLPTNSFILPLGAAVSEVDSLAIWLDRESKDEEDLEAERDAAIALAAGEYLPRAAESGDAEEEDDDAAGRDEEWERYDRARNFRSRRHEHWRRLHSYLTRSNEAVSEYPFLATWADGLQSRLATVLDEERRAFAALVQPIRLLEAAAVRVLPEPALDRSHHRSPRPAHPTARLWLTSGFPVPTTAPQHPEQWNPAPPRGDTRALGLHSLSPRHENGPPNLSADRHETSRLTT